MKSALVLAALLASAGGAVGQNVSTGVPATASGTAPTTTQQNAAPVVDTTGVSVNVSGAEVTATKKAGTDNVTTYVTEGPLGTTKTEVYEGSGGASTNSTFIPRSD